MSQHELAAGFGLNGEARRDGQSGIGHLGQARAFATQLVFHFAVAVGVTVTKEKHPGSTGGYRHKCALYLFHHFMIPSCRARDKLGSPIRTTRTRWPRSIFNGRKLRQPLDVRCITLKAKIKTRNPETRRERRKNPEE